MAETDDKLTKEERITAAKQRAAGRASSAAAPAPESGEGDAGDAAQRFQQVKSTQKPSQSRKEREEELLNRAVGVSPRSSIEKMPQSKPVKADPLPINRREFLTYAWGAGLALIALQGTAATLWFSYPRFKEGEFGGVFTLTSVPPEGEKPEDILSGKFWWSNSEEGMAALYKVCTHLGCLYEWKDQTDRFECPCHGSKFRQDGRNILGPATRDLDQFLVSVEDQAGNVVDQTNEDTRFVTAEEGLVYKVDTGRKLIGRNSDPTLRLEA